MPSIIQIREREREVIIRKLMGMSYLTTTTKMDTKRGNNLYIS